MTTRKTDKSGIRRILITAVILCTIIPAGLFGVYQGQKVKEESNSLLNAPEISSEEVSTIAGTPPTFEQEVVVDDLQSAMDSLEKIALEEGLPKASVEEEVTEKKPGFFKRLFSKKEKEDKSVSVGVLTVHPNTFVSSKAMDALMSESSYELCSEKSEETLSITLCSEVNGDVAGSK